MNETVVPSPASGAGKRVLVVDDHPLFRHGIVSVIDGQGDLVICGQAADGEAALAALRALQPDIVLLDISMPGMSGIDLLKIMKKERPDLAVLMVSMHAESRHAVQALRAGALGYLVKSDAVAEVPTAIRKVLAGEISISPRFSSRLIFQAIQASQSGSATPVDLLSPRERQVLELIGTGQGTREISALLDLSVKTVETHRAHIKEKLHFEDAGEMIGFATDWMAGNED